jgi:glucose-1-phosphate thymidylyltransferase
MRPHTHTKAKPLLPVAGKPVLDHVLDCLKGLDISEYIFITGHLKEQIEEHIKKNYTFKARFIEQQVKDGTAGACRLAEPYVHEPLLIVFVDTIFDADLSVIKASEDDGIIWAKEVEDYQRFGVIVHDKQGHVTSIVEKPTEPISKLANIGLYYIRNHALFFEGIRYVYEKDLKVKGEYFLPEAFMYMIRKGAKLKVLGVDGWYDCGAPETTLESNAILLKRRHAVKSPVTETKIIEPVFIDKGCAVEGCVIGPNVSVAEGCTLKNAVLKDCIIDRNSTVKDVTLSESILGEETFIEGRSREHRASLLLGDHAKTWLR